MVQRQDRRDGLDAAGAAEEVTRHRLRRGDRDVVQVVAQDLAQRLQLRDVALRRGRRVRVEVHDLGRLEVRLVQQVLHRRGDAAPGRLGLGDVVGVRGQPLAQHLAVDPGAARGGVLRGLQDDDAGALTEDEAVPAGVVRTRGLLGLVVALGHRHHVGERGDRQRVDRRLGATGEDHVGTAGADHLDGVPDRLGTRRTGGDRGVDARPGVHLDTHVGGRAVGHEHGHGVRGDAAYALLLQHVVLVEQGDHAADAGGDDRTQPLGLDLLVLTGGTGEARVRPRLAGRDQRELRRAVQLAGERAGQDVSRVDGREGRDPDRQFGETFALKRLDAGTAGHQTFPGRCGIATQRSGCADTGDDHGAIGRAHWKIFSTCRGS